MPSKERVYPNPVHNYYTIHRIGGRIELYINETMVGSFRYKSETNRQELIDRWRCMYPIKEHQTRHFVIIPNWNAWNGIV